MSLSRIIKGNAPNDTAVLFRSPYQFDVEVAPEEVQLTEEWEEGMAPLEAAEPTEEELQSMADQIRAQALLEAEEILKEAKKKALFLQDEAVQKGMEEGRVRGFEEGFEKGVAEGNQKADEQYKAAVTSLETQLATAFYSITEEKEKMLEQYLDDLKNISLAIGEKIVQISLKSSGQVVERMILAATEKMKKVAWAKVYIGSDASFEIQTDAQFLKELSKLADHVKVVMMEDGEQGTCIVETPDGILDISVKTQLENIKEILNNARA